MSGDISDAAFTSTTLCLLLDREIHILPYDSSEIITVMELAGVHHLAGRSIHMAGVCVINVFNYL